MDAVMACSPTPLVDETRWAQFLIARSDVLYSPPSKLSSSPPMITRRNMMTGSLGLALLPGVASSQAIDLEVLPGKKPLLRRTFRPPNFETPLVDLRSPFTANDAFFVRYHLSAIPEADAEAINARSWRLRIGGASASRAQELSLDELRRDFKRVSVVAINQCSGNRRGLFTPRVPGVQWEHGAV